MKLSGCQVDGKEDEGSWIMFYLTDSRDLSRFHGVIFLLCKMSASIIKQAIPHEMLSSIREEMLLEGPSRKPIVFL